MLRVGEVYFDQRPTDRHVDVVRYNQAPEPLCGTEAAEFWTIVIDLNESIDSLFGRLKKDTRNEVRRCAKDGLQYNSWSSGNSGRLVEFCDFHDRFAATKLLPQTNRPRLAAIQKLGRLTLSCVSHGEGETLTWHAYYCSRERARLIYSASLHKMQATPASRSLVGRANRFHHWSDIVQFKQLGLKTYDLGGWYHGTEDVEKLKINIFKQEFGGKVIKEYNCLQGVTLAGKFAIHVLRTFDRLPKY